MLCYCHLKIRNFLTAPHFNFALGPIYDVTGLLRKLFKVFSLGVKCKLAPPGSEDGRELILPFLEFRIGLYPEDWCVLFKEKKKLSFHYVLQLVIQTSQETSVLCNWILGQNHMWGKIICGLSLHMLFFVPQKEPFSSQ